MQKIKSLVVLVIAVATLALIWWPVKVPDPQIGDSLPVPTFSISSTLTISGTGVFTITDANGDQAVLVGPLTIEN